MGFTRLTPENSTATWVAGVTTFFVGGALVTLIGLGGLSLAALNVISFAWEQAALVVIGAVLVVIGLLIPRKRARLNSH
jgi:hypothetical protein